MPTRFVTSDDEIKKRLSEFGVTREELIHVVREVVGARADMVEDDPASTAGQFGYIYGTRNTRIVFRAKGWLIDRKDNIEAVKHPTRQLKVVYQNVDLACELMHVPQSISGKRSGSERAIDDAQGWLFSSVELCALDKRSTILPPIGLWYLCVSVNGEDVRAELSKAAAVSGGNFGAFDERIFIVRKGEWASIRVPALGATDFEPVIRRKQKDV